MDFNKESAKDLPTHGYDSSVPTCWILEGLVMYLQKAESLALLTELTALTPKGSILLLNYYNSPKPGHATFAEMQELLKEKGWTGEVVSPYGSPEMNFGRFPEGVPI